MTFSHYAGVAVVPTLSRIVLCAMFITAGFMKFKDADFNAEQAATLRSLGVSVSPKAKPATPATSPTASANRLNNVEFKLASYQVVQDEPATQPESAPPEVPDDSPAEAAPQVSPKTPPKTFPETAPQTRPELPATSPSPDSEEPGETPSPTDPTIPGPFTATAPAPAADELFTASSMHHVTLMLHARGWAKPVMQAWLVAMTELIAGALLAIGLFSRLWGFALAIVMGVAFYLTSWPALVAANYSLFALAADPNPLALAGLGLQSALFVLALGIFLTGPGPISLDRLLFGGRTEVIEVAEVRSERH